MTRADARRHELRVIVSKADIDELGHVNNVVYVKWVQEVAAAHWQAATTPEQRKQTVWVVLKHEIEYEAPAFEEDVIVARTWVESWSGAKSDRRTEILRPSDGILLARARTVWCAVDPRTGRPRRVDRTLTDGFFEESGDGR